VLAIMNDLFDDGTVMEHNYTVRHTRNLFVMGDQNQSGLTFALKFEKKLQDGPAVFGIQIAGGFICKNDFRIVDQGATHGHPLHFTPRKLMGKIGAPSFKADARQEGLRFFMGLRIPS
jgi:hypothetical protein